MSRYSSHTFKSAPCRCSSTCKDIKTITSIAPLVCSFRTLCTCTEQIRRIILASRWLVGRAIKAGLSVAMGRVGWALARIITIRTRWWCSSGLAAQSSITIITTCSWIVLKSGRVCLKATKTTQVWETSKISRICRLKARRPSSVQSMSKGKPTSISCRLRRIQIRPITREFYQKKLCQATCTKSNGHRQTWVTIPIISNNSNSRIRVVWRWEEQSNRKQQVYQLVPMSRMVASKSTSTCYRNRFWPISLPVSLTLRIRIPRTRPQRRIRGLQTTLISPRTCLTPC